MALELDDLLNDGRLERLFSKEVRHCALQLWILQIKSEKSTDNRVVYGRLIPYSYSNECWSSGDDVKLKSVGKVKARVALLNLFVKSVLCADLLRQLSAGQTISVISEELKLGLSEQLKASFGATALSTTGLVYRPVAYLLNRDAHDQYSPSSPHEGAGAFSASITQTDKEALLCVGSDYDADLTASVVTSLNGDTGHDFGGVDAARFGDLELLVFPALDDQERHLLSVAWVDEPCALVARFNAAQLQHFCDFQFHLSILNDGQIAYSTVAIAERDVDGVFEYKFEVGDLLRARTDSTELEIFGFRGDQSRLGTLCCRWRVAYVRELHLQGHVIGNRTNTVKFDWLEKATRPSVSTRVKAALTINRDNMGFANRVGGREADPWVPVNRDFLSLFARLYPPKSEGRFFLRRDQGDGAGRLQFVEWFKSLLSNYRQHQIVVFDPYFEDAGLGLMVLCAEQNADYIVFRSLPEKSTKEGGSMPDESDKFTPSGINNLLANCEHNRHALNRIKLRIYGLKHGRLHDRYILIMGADKLPVAGFNLSNSFQTATQSHPLLVTPIPADVLLVVERYASDLVREANVTQVNGRADNLTMRLLFDSAAQPTVPRRYEPLSFLDRPQASEVLAVWTSEPSLKNLNGDKLKEQMTVLDLLKGDSLSLQGTAGLSNCLDQQAGDFENFTAIWDVLGEVLAHTYAEDYRFRDHEPELGFLEFLARFLETSFNRVHDEVDHELAVVDARLFREPVETLLHSSYHPHQLFHATKYAAVSWAEYFAIKFLWWYSPAALLVIIEAHMACVPMEPQASEVVRLSLLSQIVSDISLAVEFDISEEQQARLVRSGNGLLQWIGLHAMKMQLGKTGVLAATLQLVAEFTYSERVCVLGWMVNHAAGDSKKVDVYKALVSALHEALPPTVLADDLMHLVDSLLGHMHQLSRAEPWLFQDVVFPLLKSRRANTDDACNIWIQALIALLEPEPMHQSRLFSLAHEGQTTNITALLFAYSSPKRQQASLKSIQVALVRQRRILQQPLASTSDWARWDDALMISMWILTFTRWVQYYLREREMTDPELEKLSRAAYDLAMIRPMVEWRSKEAGKQFQLTALLDQVDGLLATNDV